MSADEITVRPALLNDGTPYVRVDIGDAGINIHPLQASLLSNRIVESVVVSTLQSHLVATLRMHKVDEATVVQVVNELGTKLGTEIAQQ